MPVVARTSNVTYALALLAGANALNYADRTALSVLVDPIKADLQLSDTQIGIATGLAFSILYALLGLPMARIADVGIRRNLIAVAMAFWAVATSTCGLVQNYAQLLLARVLVGIGDAGAVSPSYSLLADLYDRNRRVLAISLLTAGGAAGASLGAALAGVIAEQWNWRTAFLLLGVPGLVLAFLIRFSMEEPRRGAVDGVDGNSAAPDWRSSVSSILATPTYRWLLAGGSLLAFFVYGISLWTPAFYMRTHHMTVAEVGIWIGVIGGISGILATGLGGLFAARLARRDERWVLWFSALTTVLAIPFMVVSLAASDRAFSLAAMLIGQTIASMAVGPMLGQVPAVVALKERAVASAVMGAAFSLVGLSASGLAIGLLSDALEPYYATDSLRWALLSTMALPLGCALALWAAARHVRLDSEKALVRSGSPVP